MLLKIPVIRRVCSQANMYPQSRDHRLHFCFRIFTFSPSYVLSLLCVCDLEIERGIIDICGPLTSIWTVLACGHMTNAVSINKHQSYENSILPFAFQCHHSGLVQLVTTHSVHSHCTQQQIFLKLYITHTHKHTHTSTYPSIHRYITRRIFVNLT
jgi:hypothetical protein